jgi:hypothetical protein
LSLKKITVWVLKHKGSNPNISLGAEASQTTANGSFDYLEEVSLGDYAD